MKEYNIKKQTLEIVTYNDFVKEITDSHLDYLKNQIFESDFERLEKSLKEKDVVECSAIIKHWHINLNDVTSGMFRKYIRFMKNYDGYILSYNDVEFYFSSEQVLFVLESGIIIPIDINVKDYLIEKT